MISIRAMILLLLFAAQNSAQTSSRFDAKRLDTTAGQQALIFMQNQPVAAMD